MEITLTQEQVAAIEKVHGDATVYAQNYVSARADFLIAQQTEDVKRKNVAVLLAKTPEELEAAAKPFVDAAIADALAVI